MSDNHQRKIIQIGILFDNASESKNLKNFIQPFIILIKALDKGLEFPKEINQGDKESIILISSAYRFQNQKEIIVKMKNIIAKMKIIIRIFEYII